MEQLFCDSICGDMAKMGRWLLPCLAFATLFIVVRQLLPVPSSATPGSARVPEETFLAVSPPRFRHARSRAAVPPTSRSALPEVSLVLADLQPTPTVVSSAFNVITFLPQYLWLLMVLAPNWSVTRKIMEPLWPVLLFAAVHIFIVINVASVNSDNLSDFTELAKVFDPRVSTNLFGDFSPQAAMLSLMQMFSSQPF
eukprot:s539_g29.t1